MPDYHKIWTNKAKELLVGKKIKSVGYLSKEECEELDWHRSALFIELDDGTVLYPSQDDEGNGPGAIFTTNDDLPTIPVI